VGVVLVPGKRRVLKKKKKKRSWGDKTTRPSSSQSRETIERKRRIAAKLGRERIAKKDCAKKKGGGEKGGSQKKLEWGGKGKKLILFPHDYKRGNWGKKKKKTQEMQTMHIGDGSFALKNTPNGHRRIRYVGRDLGKKPPDFFNLTPGKRKGEKLNSAEGGGGGGGGSEKRIGEILSRTKIGGRVTFQN